MALEASKAFPLLFEIKNTGPWEGPTKVRGLMPWFASLQTLPTSIMAVLTGHCCLLAHQRSSLDWLLAGRVAV